MHHAFKVAPLAAAIVLAGCGGGEDPPAARGPASEAAATVEAFEQAVGARDYSRICRDLLSGEARRRMGGEDCPRRLRASAGSVRRPMLRVERIDVRGNTATVQLIAGAAGAPPARERLELVRQDGAFRIAALAG